MFVWCWRGHKCLCPRRFQTFGATETLQQDGFWHLSSEVSDLRERRAAMVTNDFLIPSSWDLWTKTWFSQTMESFSTLVGKQKAVIHNRIWIYHFEKGRSDFWERHNVEIKHSFWHRDDKTTPGENKRRFPLRRRWFVFLLLQWEEETDSAIKPEIHTLALVLVQC